jgi:hypothetical protein
MVYLLATCYFGIGVAYIALAVTIVSTSAH